MPAGLSPMDFYLLLPETVLTIGAILVLVADALLPRERQGWAIGLALAVIGATVAAVLVVGDPHATVARGLFAVDAFGVFFKLLFLGASAVTLLMSVRYLRIQRAATATYAFLVLTAALGMMVMASGTDLITLFIGLETMSVSFYVLAGFLKPNRRSNEAAMKYYLLGAFSVGMLLYGMSILYGLTGTTNLRAIAQQVAQQGASPLLALAIILVVAGLAFKIAAVPFHMWAPDVYEGSPTPITALLSVGSKAAAFAMILRLFVEGLPSAGADWRLLFDMLAVVTMVVGNIAALTQTNLKRMLAYSSIAHAGYILIGIVAGTPRGVTASLIYLAVYAFMQLGAFAVIVLLQREETGGDDLDDFSGLYYRRPAAAIAMLVFMLSLGGIPPTAGFMGKFWLFGAAIEAGYIRLAVLGVLMSALSLYYYLRVVIYMWQRTEVVEPLPSPGPAWSVAVAVAVLGTVLFGLYPSPVFDAADVSARALGAVISTAAR